jgi:hypothetical protein
MEQDLRTELSRGAYQEIVARLRDGADIEVIAPPVKEAAPAGEETAPAGGGTSQ